MSLDADADLLQEELCALGAIFGDDCIIDDSQRSLVAWVPSKDATPRFELRVRFPVEGYPSEQPPEIDIHAPHLSDDVLDKTIDELYDIFLPGEVGYAHFRLYCMQQGQAGCSWMVGHARPARSLHGKSCIL